MEAQPQQRVVDLAEGAQRPEIGPGGADGFRRIGLCAFGPTYRQLGCAAFAIQSQLDVTVAYRVRGHFRRKCLQQDARPLQLRFLGGQREGALAHGLLKATARKHAVH